MDDVLQRAFGRARQGYAVFFATFLYAIGYVAYSFWKDRQGGGNVNHSAHLSGAIYGVLFMIAMEPDVIEFFLQRLSNPSFR